MVGLVAWATVYTDVAAVLPILSILVGTAPVLGSVPTASTGVELATPGVHWLGPLVGGLDGGGVRGQSLE